MSLAPPWGIVIGAMSRQERLAHEHTSQALCKDDCGRGGHGAHNGTSKSGADVSEPPRATRCRLRPRRHRRLYRPSHGGEADDRARPAGQCREPPRRKRRRCGSERRTCGPRRLHASRRPARRGLDQSDAHKRPWVRPGQGSSAGCARRPFTAGPGRPEHGALRDGRRDNGGFALVSGGSSFASPGPGTPGHVAVELLRARTKSRLNHVPFEGGGPALDALIEGRVDMYFAVLPSAMPHVTSGKLKILGVSSTKRSQVVPNVPTVAEQTGIQGFDLTNWVGVFAPRGTPTDVVVRLNREINQVLAQPDVVEQLVRHGAEATPMSVDQFAAFLKSESSKYEGLLRDEFCAKFLYGGCTGFVALP